MRNTYRTSRFLFLFWGIYFALSLVITLDHAHLLLCYLKSENMPLLWLLPMAPFSKAPWDQGVIHPLLQPPSRRCLRDNYWIDKEKNKWMNESINQWTNKHLRGMGSSERNWERRIRKRNADVWSLFCHLTSSQATRARKNFKDNAVSNPFLFGMRKQIPEWSNDLSSNTQWVCGERGPDPRFAGSQGVSRSFTFPSYLAREGLNTLSSEKHLKLSYKNGLYWSPHHGITGCI